MFSKEYFVKNIEKLTFIFLCLFTLVVFTPLVYFSFWLVPNLEDFSLSSVDQHHHVFNYVKALYLSFDGRYSTNFIHYFNPLSFKWVAGYSYLPLLLMLLFFSALSSFVYTILKWLKVEFRLFEALVSAGFIAACFFSWIYSLPHILYWFGSALVYFLPISCFLFVVAFYLQNRIAKSKGKEFLFLSLSAFFLFIGVGLSELSLFFFNAIIASYLLYLLWHKKKVPVAFIFLIGVLIISSLIFVAAPGIWVRKEMFTRDTAMVPFYMLGVLFIKHNAMFVISAMLPSIFCAVGINLYWRERVLFKQLELKKAFRFFLFILCLIVFTSLAFYIPRGYEDFFPARIFNSIWGFYLILILPLLFVVIDRLPLSSKLILAVWALGAVFYNPNKPMRLSWDLLNSKEYISHYESYQQRMETLFNAKKENLNVVYIEPFNVKNRVLTNPPYLTPNKTIPCWNNGLEVYFEINNVLLVGDTIKPN